MPQHYLDQWLATRVFTRRQLLRLGAATGAAALLAACAPKVAPLPPAELLNSGESIPLDRLIAEARQEGQLTTMALPHDWANYGKIIETFKKKYSLAVKEIAPNAGSGEETDAVRARKNDNRLEAPDVLDVGLGFTEPGKAEGLLARYKVATWDTIPGEVKDPEGYWCGNYYGVLAFEVNLSVVETLPQDWPDLFKPEYKNRIALAGDPTVSSQAVYSVWAAGFSRTGSLDSAPRAGLEFFAELYKAGNFMPGSYDQDGKFAPLIAGLDTVKTGQTPIIVQWDYLGLSNRDTLKGNPDMAIVVPRSGVLAGLYAQAVSAYASHPFAARLWEELLYSDEGQLMWLEGYVHPVRYNDLVRRYKVPAELAAKLPPPENYAQAIFPTLAQITQATKVITENWRQVILGTP